jgi:exodeoxyribonuclease-3
MQETKAQEHQVSGDDFSLPGYHRFYFDAQKPGYSGVAIFSRKEPDRVIRGIKVPEFDNEGRYMEARFGEFAVVSLYLPSGSSGEHRQASKFRFLEAFMPYLKRLKRSGRSYVLCGDWNIAHQNIDLKNWRSNRKNSGFLPEERAWLDELFGRVGYVDAFREVNKEPDQYTWWSNRGQAWAKNVGWRIDYQIVSSQLAGKARAASVYKDQRFSDHAPLIMDYAL